MSITGKKKLEWDKWSLTLSGTCVFIVKNPQWERHHESFKIFLYIFRAHLLKLRRGTAVWRKLVEYFVSLFQMHAKSFCLLQTTDGENGNYVRLHLSEKRTILTFGQWRDPSTFIREVRLSRRSPQSCSRHFHPWLLLLRTSFILLRTRKPCNVHLNLL